jgi:hypothetical protein
MPDAIVPANDAVDRVVAMFRARLEAAFANGQRVRMSAREGTSSRAVSVNEFAHSPLSDLLTRAEPDGSFELHVYIEPKTR